jgi:hypothetical protein
VSEHAGRHGRPCRNAVEASAGWAMRAGERSDQETLSEHAGRHGRPCRNAVEASAGWAMRAGERSDQETQ